MWVPGGMATLVGGGLVGGISYGCQGSSVAWETRVEGMEGEQWARDQGALPPGLNSWSCRARCSGFCFGFSLKQQFLSLGG